MMIMINVKFKKCSIRRPNLMATSLATSRAKSMAMAVAICRATWMEQTDGGQRLMATSVAKNTGKYVAGAKAQAAN